MKKQIRKAAALLLTVCTIAGMSACASGGGEAGGTAGQETESKTGKTDVVTIIEEPNVVYYPIFIEKLKEQYPDYNITSKTWEQSQVEKTVKTAFAGGESIDVVKWYPNQMETFISSDMALDLTPYMDDEWKSVFVDGALDIGTYDGKLYCLPNSTVYPDIDINVDIFEAAGVEVKEHWTWDEFVDACEKIKANTDAFPFGISDTRCGWFQRNALLQIWETRDEMEEFIDGKISFRDDRVVSALDNINELFTKEYAYPGDGAFSQTKDQIEAAFTQGKIAMMCNVNNGGKNARKLMAEAGNENVRTVSWPSMATGECDYVLGGCDGYFIPANTKNVDAAVNILKYLTSPEAFEYQVEDGDVVPAKVEGSADEEFSRDSNKVYPKEILSLSAEMNDYVNYNIAANYFYDKENALTELEALRESAQ